MADGTVVWAKQAAAVKSKHALFNIILTMAAVVSEGRKKSELHNREVLGCLRVKVLPRFGIPPVDQVKSESGETLSSSWNRAFTRR